MSQRSGNGAQPILPPGTEPAGPRERPILFSGSMVRAILDGRKTQTRRVVKPAPPPRVAGLYRPFQAEPNNWQGFGRDSLIHWYGRCPYGVLGDVLWVREAWRMPDTFDNVSPQQARAMVVADQSPNVFYAADGSVRSAGAHTGRSGKTRVSIHMPRWASRISLRVTDVRVERLNEISEADALAEGIDWVENNYGNGPAYCDYLQADVRDTAEWFNSPINSYQSLWQTINGSGSWAANPWVWAVSFEVITPPSAHDTSSATDPLRDANT